MTPELETLAEKIASTLRSVIHVPRLNPASLLASPEFWDRCRLLFPRWRDRYLPRIFVDGFVGACQWNSWKVYNDALEDGITVWYGYAFSRGSWTEHAWCMLAGCIVETTAPFPIYYGAQLDPEELARFTEKFGGHDLAQRKHLRVATMIDGYREVVPYDPTVYTASIGRERDPKTREIQQGLGRRTMSLLW